MSDSNNNKTNPSGGIGFCGLLTIVLIVLKLLNKITWSWIWVLSPLWISTEIGILILAIGLLLILIGYIQSNK